MPPCLEKVTPLGTFSDVLCPVVKQRSLVLPSSLLLARTFWLANLTCLTGPLPSPKRNARPLSPTDPAPAGPRTRHLARKLGILDGHNAPGPQTPPPSPSSACDHLIPQSGGLGGLESGRSAALGVRRGNALQAMIEPTRRATLPTRWAAPGGQDLRGSSPALPSYSCFAAARLHLKCGWACVSASPRAPLSKKSRALALH
jgi:hypothetical protein